MQNINLTIVSHFPFLQFPPVLYYVRHFLFSCRLFSTLAIVFCILLYRLFIRRYLNSSRLRYVTFF